MVFFARVCQFRLGLFRQKKHRRWRYFLRSVTDLAGIKEVLGVKDLLDALHEPDGGIAKLAAEVALLGVADAMLTGN